MAVSLTRNLKLKIDDALDANSKYNLNRLDALGSIYQINTLDQAVVRSKTDVLIQPNSGDIGGTGVGGNVIFGEPDQLLTSVTFYANAVSFLGSGVTLGSLSDVVLTSPTAGQVLTFNGTSWINSSISASLPQQMTTTWTNGDGSLKAVMHNFGTQKILVQVLDTSNYSNIEVDSITRPTSNEILLSSSQAPIGTWLVLLQEIKG